MPRRDITAAPYNPRTITDEARRRLRANVERVGLLEPIVWNRRTGHVVGGHQRLKALDALEGTLDYLVPVAVVDLSEREEKAQNVFLNNAEAQGQWDVAALGDLLREIEAPELAGFDHADLYHLFGTDPVSAATDDRAAELAAVAREATERFKAAAEAGVDREAHHFYLVVVFPDDAARLRFTAGLGLPDNRYVDGRRLERLLAGKGGDRGEGPAGTGEGEAGAAGAHPGGGRAAHRADARQPGRDRAGRRRQPPGGPQVHPQ